MISQKSRSVSSKRPKSEKFRLKWKKYVTESNTVNLKFPIGSFSDVNFAKKRSVSSGKHKLKNSGSNTKKHVTESNGVTPKFPIGSFKAERQPKCKTISAPYWD